MAEVFISYSRKDKEFVRRLGEGLVAHQRETWVDWKDIPLTSEWQQEILTNIEAADNFIFVISPSSVASVNCRKEIDHAAANHKKMLPLLYLPVADEDVPQTLGRFQRLEFSHPENFEAKLELLIAAMDADLPWIQAHTRLLTRAKEWERSTSDSSFLLRGKDLREGEQWLAKSSDREPKPTTLQSQYILASRQGATRTQRIIFAAVAAALLVAIGLAIYAFLQRNVANVQRTKADANAKMAIKAEGLAEDSEADARRQKDAAETSAESARVAQRVAQKNEAEATRQKGIALDETAKAVLQAKIANGRRLAAEASYRFGAIGGGNLTSSGALAIESLRSYPTTDGMKAMSDVLRLLTSKPKILSSGYPGQVESIAFSHDGRWMASGSDRVLLWDLSGRNNPRELQTAKGVPLWPPVKAVAFSDDGRWLAAGWKEAVGVWDVRSGEALPKMIQHGYVVRSISFSPDGLYLATTTYGEGQGRGVRVFRKNSQEWEELEGFPTGQGTFTSALFLPDGLLAVADRTGVWMTKPGASMAPSGSTEDSIGHISQVRESPGRKAFNAESTILKLGSAGFCYALSLSSDKSTLAALCDKGVWVSKLRDNGYSFRNYAFEGDITAFPPNDVSLDQLQIAVSNRGDQVAVGGIVYQVNAEAESSRLFGGDSRLVSVSFRPNGEGIAGGLQDGSIALWRAGEGNQAFRISEAAGRANGVDFSPDERFVATAGNDGALRLFDVSEPECIRQVKAATIDARLGSVTFSPDGRVLAVIGTGKIFLLRSDSLKQFASFSAAYDASLAFSGDGHMLVVNDANGIRRFDVGSGQEKTPAIPGNFQEFRFSPDGVYLSAWSQVRIGGAHHTIEGHRVWRLADGVEVAWVESGREQSDGPALREERGGPQTLVNGSLMWINPLARRYQSADGVWTADVNRNSHTLLLEEAANRRTIAKLEHDGDVTDGTFSPSGRWLVSSSEDGLVRLWPLRAADVVAQACKLLPRNLTSQEWSDLKMDGPYRKTCPDLP